MTYITTYQNRKVYWLDYANFQDQLPDKDWVCLFTANLKPDYEKFEKFTRIAISKNILEFKGHGLFGEKLHDYFDEIMSFMEAVENLKEINVMTTGHDDQTLADAFWQCFFITYIPNNTDLDNIAVVVADLDGVDRSAELKSYIERFEKGWLPE